MKKLYLLAVLILTGCPSYNPHDPSDPPAPINPPDSDLCETMCDHIGPSGLDCEEGKPLYNSDLLGDPGVPNQSCADACHEWQDKGVFVNPRCVSTVPSCDLIEDYRQKDPAQCIIGD